MKPQQWFTYTFSDGNLQISKSEFSEFLTSKYVTFGKLQDKTIGKIFCETYNITDGLLCAFAADDFCIDRIKTFYVRKK
jgi:hypothetical protein